MTKSYRSGQFVWRELMTTDAAASVRFYTEVLGWKTDMMKMPDGMDYTVVKAGETGVECGKVAAATSGAFSMQTTAICVWALGTVGHTAEARRLLQTLEHAPAGVWLDPPVMGTAYGGVGDLNRALEWFQKGLDERAPNMIYAKVGPTYDFARGDPRFLALLKRMKFPD